MQTNNKVYLSLGSNIGNRALTLQKAEALIVNKVGKIVAASRYYETEPVGFKSDNMFLNSVICVETELTPFELLHATQEIERTLGRTHKSVDGVYCDRPIDIDILYYNDIKINTPELTIPHPRILERDFVLKPLLEIAPNII